LRLLFALLLRLCSPTGGSFSLSFSLFNFGYSLLLTNSFSFRTYGTRIVFYFLRLPTLSPYGTLEGIHIKLELSNSNWSGFFNNELIAYCLLPIAGSLHALPHSWTSSHGGIYT